MIVEPERQKRYRLFEYVAKPLDSFVEPDHILRRIEEAINSPELATPLEAAYAADRGRPAIPLEVLLRALTLGFRKALSHTFMPQTPSVAISPPKHAKEC